MQTQLEDQIGFVADSYKYAFSYLSLPGYCKLGSTLLQVRKTQFGKLKNQLKI